MRLRRLAIPITLALAVTATPFLHNAPDHPAVPSRHTRAVFISQHGGALFHHTGTLDEVLHGVATSGYNEVYFGVYGLGGPFFPSRHGPSNPAYVPPWTDPLREAIRQAHRQGLRTGAWFEYGLMLQPGSAIARRHPEWLLRLPGGRSVVEGR
ncbi:MAG: family 10 glycosylhydrolase, partial [Candidatus Sericytochromatia bacterium]|nr:family 10 glycosylhydrolase [Candidatus Sericytochromatia bacterium]